MATGCDKDALGAYAFGALEVRERETIAQHVNGCRRCRAELAELEEVTRMLGELPPEAVLTGPPDGGELVLQRTLRQLRAEVAGAGRRRQLRQGVGAAAAMAACIVAGVALGRSTAPQPTAQPVTSPTVQASVVPGTKVASAVDAQSNTRLVATMVPAQGWVRLNVAVSGVARGEKCRIVVVNRDGGREIAASWVVSEKGEAEGTNVDAAAAVPLDEVTAVEVQTAAGKTLVSLKI
ncbi:MAG TPA: zf-HC2 domain-containing protein [Candidatus Limnocylindrales bacterium]|nr:zf-HC2 domain-containing protein [Candidatus Limnocylindrales bacterium]